MLSKLLASIVLLVILPASNLPVAAKKPKGRDAYAGGFKWQRKTNLNDVPQHCQPTTEGHRPTHTYVDLSKSKERRSPQHVFTTLTLSSQNAKRAAYLAQAA